jgi:transposase
MAAPYSGDLRQKAVEAVKRGERKKDVREIFDISRNTLDLWLKRVEEIGNKLKASLSCLSGYGRKPTYATSPK